MKFALAILPSILSLLLSLLSLPSPLPSLLPPLSSDILEDPKQQLYTQCCYTYKSSSGSSIYCHNPVLRYQDPPLCGGHLDHTEVHLSSETEDEEECAGHEGKEIQSVAEVGRTTETEQSDIST